MRRGRTHHDAEDLVQEAWIRLACYERQTVVEKPEALLMTAALHLAIDVHRAEVRRGEQVALEDVELIDEAPGQEAVLLARERMTRLGACLERLNETTCAIFLAHRVDGMSYQQIATARGISVSAVEKHIAKATLQLMGWMRGW